MTSSYPITSHRLCDYSSVCKAMAQVKHVSMDKSVVFLKVSCKNACLHIIFYVQPSSGGLVGEGGGRGSNARRLPDLNPHMVHGSLTHKANFSNFCVTN